MEFPTTHWTMLAQATLHGDSVAEKALESFILRYREPVLRVIRSRGVAESRAEDLTHDFLLRLMQNSTLRQADPGRGRFRSFLGTALKYFLADDMDRTRAQKRGGGAQHLSLNAEDALADSLAAAGCDASALLDREWAVHLMTRVGASVEDSWSRRGKTERYAVLRCFLPGSQEMLDPDEAAARLGMTPVALRTEIHRLRRQFITQLRAEVAATVGTPSEVDEELRYLSALLAQPSPDPVPV